MAKYQSNLSTMAPDRGNCLMLFKEKLASLRLIGKENRNLVLMSLCEWFLDTNRKKEDAMEDCKKKATGDEEAKENAVFMLKQFIEEQQRHGMKYYNKCVTAQRNVLAKEAKRRQCERGADAATVYGAGGDESNADMADANAGSDIPDEMD